MTPRADASAPAPALLALLLALVLAGCGLPEGGRATAVPVEDVPYGLLSPAASPDVEEVPGAGAASPPDALVRPLAQVWLVGPDDLLRPAPLERPAGPQSDVERRAAVALAELADGPTAEQRQAALATALPSAADLRLEGVSDGVASVELALPASGPVADRLPLAVGQVVLTATSVPGVDAVQLLADGEPLEVPLPDGARAARPLTAADYAAVTAPGPSRTPSG